MKFKIVNHSRNIIVKLGIGCVVCLLLGFGFLLHAQDKTEVEFIATKPELNPTKQPEIDSAKTQEIMKMKEQAAPQRSRFRERQQNRRQIDFGENAAFYKVIIDNNLFRPLGWTPPNNEPAYSLVGTAVGADGTLSQATLLEKRSNRYHFVTIGTKLGDMTVKDIQAKQVTLDKAGEALTLKAGTLQFLSTNRERGGNNGTQAREGQAEKAGNMNAQNSQANAKAEAEKRRQMEMQKQAAAFGIKAGDLREKLRDASPEERQEIMREIRRRSANRRGRGNRNR